MYWNVVTFELPTIAFVARVPLKCSATESDMERLFSSESVVHDCLRNSLDPEVIEAIVRVRNNYPYRYPPLVLDDDSTE